MTGDGFVGVETDGAELLAVELDRCADRVELIADDVEATLAAVGMTSTVPAMFRAMADDDRTGAQMVRVARDELVAHQLGLSRPVAGPVITSEGLRQDLMDGLAARISAADRALHSDVARCLIESGEITDAEYALEIARVQARVDAAMISGDPDAYTSAVAELAAVLWGVSLDGSGTDGWSVQAMNNYWSRVTEVMHTTGLDRDAAIEHVAAIDAMALDFFDQGVPLDMAVSAAAIAVHHGHSAAEVADAAAAFGANIVDGAALLAQADMFGFTLDELGAFLAFREHFATLADGDDKVSWADLENVVANPQDWSADVVLTAELILGQPKMFHRFDTAAENTEILDGEFFGRVDPGDRVISQADLDAFDVRQVIHSTLSPYAATIDQMHGGGRDHNYSRKDFEAFLADLPDELDNDQTRTLINQILDGGLYDQGFWERHWDEIVTIAAVIAGGAVLIATAGTATPFVAGFLAATLAGAGAAGTVQIIGNQSFGKDWNDGLGGAMLRGGLIGGAIYSLPATLGGYTGATTTGGRILHGSLLTSETTGIVAAGGADIILPEDWEDPIHTTTGAVSAVTGIPAITYIVGRGGITWLVRRYADNAAVATTKAGNGAAEFENWGGEFIDDGARIVEQPPLINRAEGAGRNSRLGDLIDVDVDDHAARKLAQRLGGKPSVRFAGDPSGREFDVVSDAHVAQSKPANFQLGSSFRNQAKATFEAALETNRTPYFHFEGPPHPDVIAKLQEYSRRFGIEAIIDVRPLG